MIKSVEPKAWTNKSQVRQLNLSSMYFVGIVIVGHNSNTWIVNVGYSSDAVGITLKVIILAMHQVVQR